MAYYLDPKNDLRFKRVFGAHKHLCKSLLILYAAWFCAMKADLFFPVRGRISIEISAAPLSLFPVPRSGDSYTASEYPYGQ
jgi:hypothetical protein